LAGPGFALSNPITPIQKEFMNGPSAAKVGVITCGSLVVANMIGTGVFTSLGFQLQAVSQPMSILLLWFLGGIFALSGALCYAEVASALPRSGGEYHFLGKIYHPALGFMAGVVSLIAGFSAPVALSGLAFGKYFQAVLPEWSPVALGFSLVTLVTACHLLHLSFSSIFQVFFTALKIILVAGLALAGFLYATPVDLDYRFSTLVLEEAFRPSFAVSLMFALYAYSGWNAATYIVGEVKNPGRTVGVALLGGTLVVMTFYLLLNASFLRVAPADDLRGQLDIGRIVGVHLFGEGGGRLVSVLIALGLVSAVSAMMWAGPRVGMVMGEDFRAFQFLAPRSKGGIPRRAVLFQYAIVLILLATGSFELVLIFTQVALVTCSALVVFGVFWLRRTQPQLDRPFKCWGYPFTPLLFLSISIFAVGYGLMENRLASFAGLGIMVLSCAGYFLFRRSTDDKKQLP